MKHKLSFAIILSCFLSICVIAQDIKKVTDIAELSESNFKGQILLEKQSKTSKQEILNAQVNNTQLTNVDIQKQVYDSSNSKKDDPEKLLVLNSEPDVLKANTEFIELNKKVEALEAELKKVVEGNKLISQNQNGPTIKFGVLAQLQGQAIQEQTTAKQDADPKFSKHWQRQLMVRRIRVLLSGNITKNTSFFFETDAPNLGKIDAQGKKDSKATMYIQDIYVQHTFMPELSVIGGLQLVGITRNGLQSAASLMALDYGSYQFITSSPLDALVGRDWGINFRGFLLDERMEYRAGVFSGKNTNLYSPLRSAFRLNYSFKDKEKGIFYSGTSLGKGQIMSLGMCFEFEKTYKGLAFDGIYDMPLSEAGSLTASASISFLNGGGSNNDSTLFTGLIPKQSIIFAEVGYYIKSLNLQPYMKYESQNVNATVLKQVGANASNLDLQNKLRTSGRFGIGINYFFYGHNANLKILYEFISRNRAGLNAGTYEKATSGTLSLQLQYFAF